MKCIFSPLQKFPNHKTLEGPETTEVVLENLYPNTIYHIWVAAKSRRGEGAATPKLAVRTEQYGKSYFFPLLASKKLFYSWQKKLFPTPDKKFKSGEIFRRPLEF